MRVGILGGGQLGRMLALAGYPLGLTFRVFDPSPGACASQVVPDHVAAAFDDEAALRRFADGLDVITYEWENVPVEAVRFLSRLAPVYPPAEALEDSQDRFVEKSLFRQLGIATAPFAAVGSLEELQQSARLIGLPAVLKTRRGGYDGKGQQVLRSEADIAPAWRELGGVPLIVEGFVPFRRELSVIAVRSPGGAVGARPGPSASADYAFYPLVENVHREGILRTSRAPAPGVSEALQAEAEDIASRVMDATRYTGVLSIELFEHEGHLLANELAPRVHNSGHWTIEGAETSQFENHLRAICGLPLGSTAPLGHSAMVNLIGAVPKSDEVLAIPGAHLHLYGKEPRPGRKLGHVTFRHGAAAAIESSLSAIARLIENKGG
jgi:5-(carboxyamino)imidazole ribonucleotide synthase